MPGTKIALDAVNWIGKNIFGVKGNVIEGPEEIEEEYNKKTNDNNSDTEKAE